jgi:hypothetical protein
MFTIIRPDAAAPTVTSGRLPSQRSGLSHDE